MTKAELLAKAIIDHLFPEEGWPERDTRVLEIIPLIAHARNDLEEITEELEDALKSLKIVLGAY